MLNIPGTQGALPSRLFSLLIHDALDAVLIIDDLGSIQYANPAFEALCGYTAQEIRGQSLNGLLPDQIARHHDQYLKNYLTGTTPSPVLRKVREMQLRHRTGEIIPIEMKAVDVGVIEGHRYLAAFMTDIRSRKRLEAQNAVYVMQLRQLALTDALTGLPNRRSFEDEAARSFARARREGHAISLAVADIDHFKAVNDTYGHHIGDMVLKTFAAALKEGLRSSDFVGRTGGEEFSLLFPCTDIHEALIVSERLRQASENLEIVVKDKIIRVTISIGLAQARPGETYEEVMLRADKALYRAKENGRNRIEI